MVQLETNLAEFYEEGYVSKEAVLLTIMLLTIAVCCPASDLYIP
jgi:hypothetical protein